MNTAVLEISDLEESSLRFGNLKIFFVVLFCLATILFFSPRFLDYSYQYYLYYMHFFVAVAFISYNNNRLYKDLYAIPFLFIIIGIFISGIVSTFSWSQSMYRGITAILPYLSYMLYFLLMVWRFETKDVEKVILIMGILFAGAYIISFITFPDSIFGGIYAEKHSEERGFQRIVMPGIGFLFLFSFYTISQYYKKKQLKWIFIFLFSLILIIMTLTRSLIVGSFILLTLYILRSSKFLFKIVAVVIVSGLVILITQMEFFKIMTELTKIQFQNMESDFRVLSAQFFLTEFSPNLAAKIFGNGLSGVDTWYNLYIAYLARRLGFYTSDIGYLGFYVTHGIITVVAFFVIIYRTIRISVPKDRLYGKYFLYFVFIVSLIVDTPFNIYWIPSIVLAAYIISSKKEENLQPVEAD